MAIYDTEEEQVEALKRWWRENSRAVITGGVLGFVLIFGVNFWRDHKREQNLQASNIYEQLMTADTEGKSEQVEKLAQNLGMQYGSTPYADFSALFEAKAKVQKGDLPAAKVILEKVVTSGDKTLKNVAKLRLINIMLASGEYEQALKLIAETDPASIQGFNANYEELKGDLYIALGRVDEARTAYENAVRDGAQSPLLQFKLDDVSALPIKPPAIAGNNAPAAPSSAPATTK